MSTPPITLLMPTYVTEFAEVDKSVKHIKDNDIMLEDKPLGKVPNIALCEDVDDKTYTIAFCDKDWKALCYSAAYEKLKDAKAMVDKHYEGISWKKTDHKKKDAKDHFNSEIERGTCSFCGRTHYDDDVTDIFQGDNARICNVCVDKLATTLKGEASA